MLQLAHQFLPPQGPSDDEDDPTRDTSAGFLTDGEDLDYRVEVWDAHGEGCEQVVAVSVSASIGFAAYYAAIREYPARTIALRHKGRIVSRWVGPAH